MSAAGDRWKEVAALIERLHDHAQRWYDGRPSNKAQQAADISAAADALARLAAPVPDRPMPLKFTNEWLKKGIESDGDDEPSAGDSPCTS